MEPLALSVLIAASLIMIFLLFTIGNALAIGIDRSIRRHKQRKRIDRIMAQLRKW